MSKRNHIYTIHVFLYHIYSEGTQVLTHYSVRYLYVCEQIIASELFSHEYELVFLEEVCVRSYERYHIYAYQNIHNICCIYVIINIRTSMLYIIYEVYNLSLRIKLFYNLLIIIYFNCDTAAISSCLLLKSPRRADDGIFLVPERAPFRAV